MGDYQSHTQLTLTSIISVSKQAISTVSTFVFLGLLLLNSNEKVPDASSALYF